MNDHFLYHSILSSTEKLTEHRPPLKFSCLTDFDNLLGGGRPVIF